MILCGCGVAGPPGKGPPWQIGGVTWTKDVEPGLVDVLICKKALHQYDDTLIAYDELIGGHNAYHCTVTFERRTTRTKKSSSTRLSCSGGHYHDQIPRNRYLKSLPSSRSILFSLFRK